MDSLLRTTKNKIYHIVLRNSVSKGILRVTESNENDSHFCKIVRAWRTQYNLADYEVTAVKNVM